MKLKRGQPVVDLRTGLTGRVVTASNTSVTIDVPMLPHFRRERFSGPPSEFVPRTLTPNFGIRAQVPPKLEGSVAETVRVLLVAYPSLALDESEVLKDLFFVNGTGFRWHRGRLVNGETSAYTIRTAYESRMRWRAANEKTFASLPVGSKLRAKALSEASDPEDPEEAKYKEYLRRERYRAEAMASVPVGPQYVSGYTRQGVRKLYPMCEYANILWVPFEVQQDWLHAARFALNEVAPTYAQTATDRRWLKLASKRLAFIEAGDREGFEAFARLRQCAPCYISAPGTQCPSCRKKMRPTKKAAQP